MCIYINISFYMKLYYCRSVKSTLRRTSKILANGLAKGPRPALARWLLCCILF